MICQFCKRRIGAVRWLIDSQFCCDEHRRAARSSARVVRGKKEIFDYYDEYSVPEGAAPESPPKPPKAPAQFPSRDSSSYVFSLLLIIGVGLGIIGLAPGARDSSEGRPLARAGKDAKPGPLRELIRAHAAVRLKADFASGLDSWVLPRGEDTAAVSRSPGGWERRSGFLKPGAFRVWEPSFGLSDYHLEFAGSIESKAINWTYRTIDSKNHYAGRLVVTKPGPLPEVQLIRYARVDGEELKKMAMRLPVTVRADSVYKVDVRVNGHEISTQVNGVMVDAWSDQRFASGGVGFWANKDEVALLRYVQITQKDSLFGRILAQFGLIHPTLIRSLF